jgi:hypothetical protein
VKANCHNNEDTRGILASVAAVASVYAFFLLFAEFAFLELVRPLGPPGVPEPMTLLPLVLGGLVGSLGAAWGFRSRWAGSGLALAQLVAVAAAALTLIATRAWEGSLAGGLTGLAVGWATVTLAAGLPRYVRFEQLGRVIGWGTGLAYGLCNVPAIFGAPPREQALYAGLVAAVGALTATQLDARAPHDVGAGLGRRGIAVGVLLFLVMVWLDSALFYLIQHTAEAKAVTWSGSERLWSNAVVHLLAAVVSGWFLDRGGSRGVEGISLAGLVLTAVLVGPWPRWAPAIPLVYPAAISAYSTALVYFAARSGTATRAALIFGVAGWIGSGLGVGMAQDLNAVPWALALAAGMAGGAFLLVRRTKAAAMVGLIFLVVVGGATTGSAERDLLTERGRNVYIAEGCIHCHSQYVRPGTIDEDRWGPVLSAERLDGAPVLIGNRRQGPDLGNVGMRRTAEWQRLHLQAPRIVSPGSRMPSYRHLFKGPYPTDGDALVAYLGSLAPSAADHQTASK